MHWYGGSIAEAVTLSKQKNAIFVVFVEGDNDLSVEMASTIDDSAVLSRLSDEKNFLAVKLKSGTTNYTHFAQIYQFVPVPSLFFIGRNGTPLEVVCAGVQPNNLASRIDRILAEHHKEKPLVQPSTSSQDVKEKTESLLEAESKAEPAPPQPKPVQQVYATEVPSSAEDPKSDSPPPAKMAKSSEYEVVCEDGVCQRRPKVDQPSTSQALTPPTTPVDDVKPVPSSSSSNSIDEKMERAKELIEIRRREKAEKEKELERQKELERRAQGQGVAELKRWQAEQELKQIQEERRREKLENSLARQRILAQIAQDRAERRARDAPQPTQATQPTQPTHAPHTTSGDSSSQTRVQFKLPDGSSHTAHFDAHGTLAVVHEYVANNLQLSSSQFALWTAFPRRELTDSAATLSALQLAPSAALLVLPRAQQHRAPTATTVSSVFAFITNLLTTLIYEPTVQLYTWLRGRLFPPPAVAPRGQRPTTPSPAAPTAPAAPALRRRTNIHRLPGDTAPDDDNNTWNGNSTQQM